ncbi:hypothetical protein K2173_022329 [Erythroxylum novogranatense]|uniref:CASP-like protein n=1 Tax=Erythroxylum novogranatense TaxID=1862640 RepID=A0AAV8THI2_9ROSI|nr:hypothetical protein K2173_022329 [Erythroxylum novogranatense]
MENQNKDGGVAVSGGGHSSTVDVLLRVLAFVLSLTAAIVLGLDKQTKVISDKSIVAKWHYLSAFVYLLVANAVASSYAALSAIISLRGKKGWWVPFIAILDLLTVAVLFSADGAAAAIGLMAYKGNSHVGWTKVCNVFRRFCGQVVAAAVLSVLGTVMFLLIVVLALLKRSK